jgi:hypothetical protein
MTRTRLSLTAFATIAGAALPAFAQAPMQMAPAPAPMMAPAPVMAPAMAPAPMPGPEAVMPVAPVVAPKAADDMSGSVGFGVGVVAGTDLVKPDTADLSMKYWLNDAMALMPKLDFAVSKSKGSDMAWKLAPALTMEFGLIKGASTRFNAVVGVGLAFSKYKVVTSTTDPDAPPAVGAPSDTTIDIFVPAGLNVEHFFTRWFSMGFGSYFNLIDFQKTGTPWTINFGVNNINYVGSLFFYTD